MPIEIVVNGEARTAPPGQTILGLLRELQLDPARVAVELDRRIVKQPLWASTTVLRRSANRDRAVRGRGIASYFPAQNSFSGEI